MSPSISWIDRESFASLVRRMQTPAERAPKASAPPAPPPPAAPSAALPSAAVPAAASPSVRVPRPSAPAPTLTPFVAPVGSIDERAAALLEWMGEQLPGDVAFVTDEHGLAVVERNANVELLATSAALMRTVRELHDILPTIQDHITLSLSPTHTLSFALAESDWGHFGAGVVSSGRLAEDAMTALTAAVRDTFEKKNGSPR